MAGFLTKAAWTFAKQPAISFGTEPCLIYVCMVVLRPRYEPLPGGVGRRRPALSGGQRSTWP
jgi:hypothetical protein